MKKVIVLIVALGMAPQLWGDQINLGVQYDGWTSNYGIPINGWEVWSPLSLSFHLAQGIRIYGQTEFANGGYTDVQTTYLANFSDTVLGSELTFKAFSVPSIFNVAFNIPTGNPTWESQQIGANVPVEFIDTRYRGRGFGISAFYGLDFPKGTSEFGTAIGYLYSGAFNPTYGLNFDPNSALKLGDSVFLSLNYLEHFPHEQTQAIRLSGFLFMATQMSGQNLLQTGPEFSASYGWNNPKALSLELGGQAFLPSQRVIGKQFTTESRLSLAPRFYLSPSFAFDNNFSVGGQVKYILTNGYAPGDPLYDGGGWLFELQPNYRFWLDKGSFLKLSATYDNVLAINIGNDQSGKPNSADVFFNRWAFGMTYEVKL